jgi:hypothetical protein
MIRGFSSNRKKMRIVFFLFNEEYPVDVSGEHEFISLIYLIPFV